MRQVAVCVLVCVWCVEVCRCFSNGTVELSCDSLMPGHAPYSPSTSPTPYRVTTSSATYRPGGLITVTMEMFGGGSSAFQGFLLQARSSEGGAGPGAWPVGRFININSNLSRALHCHSQQNSSLSQASAQLKTRVQVTWEAPRNSHYGEIYFSATFVQDYTTFWVQVNSSTLMLYNSTGPGTTGPGTTGPGTTGPGTTGPGTTGPETTGPETTGSGAIGPGTGTASTTLTLQPGTQTSPGDRPVPGTAVRVLVSSLLSVLAAVLLSLSVYY